MSKHLIYIVSLFIAAVVAAQTASAAPHHRTRVPQPPITVPQPPITVALAEKTPEDFAQGQDPSDPTTEPLPPCVPMDCGGYFACFCQVCCPDKPAPCYYADTTSGLQTAFSTGCTTAPGNSCSNCPGAPPPNPQCLWAVAFEDNAPLYEGALESHTYSDLAAVPSCFANHFGPLCGTHVSLEPDDSKQQWANCDLVMNNSDDLGAFLGDPQLTHATALADDPTADIHNYAYWYMDATCHWATPAADTPICGFAGLASSPISLIWEEDASLNDGMTVVSFSINARQPDAFSLWKASEKTPLLVYDPTHSAKVASARQLFGSYTFGGRTTKVADYESDAVRTPWGNGYEALALLDSNQDGKLGGEELNDLALWFDKNRDGVSQHGEVKSLSALGVTALYYPMFGVGEISARSPHARIRLIFRGFSRSSARFSGIA